jgi:di/tricarboxylate transporter
MSDAAISLLVLGGVVALFVWNRLPVEVVAIGSALVLLLTGVLDLGEAFAGFADPAVVMIAALFVVSEGLDATGVTTWLGQQLGRRARGSPRRLLVLAMLTSAGLTALIGLNGAVAALVPMAVVLAVRERHPTSRLMMPLAFAGSAGGLLLLTGSPVNVIVAQAALDAGLEPFGLAEFALVGVPVVLGTIAVVLALAERALPERASTMLPPDLSSHASSLVSQYALGNVADLVVEPGARALGAPRTGGLDLAPYPDVRVVTVVDAQTQRPTSDGVLAVGDRLTAVGDLDVVRRFAADHGLRVGAARGRDEVIRSLLTRETGAVEVVIPPRSRFIGEPVRPGRVVDSGQVVVLAVQRQGRDRGSAETVLRTGDVLLVEGAWEALDAAAASRDVLLVDAPDMVRRQTVPLGRHSGRAIGVLTAMIVMLATGIVPAAVAALLSAGAMIVLRVVSADQAYRRVPWSTVLLVAGMFPLSTAIATSGAGAMAAEVLVGAVQDAGPVALLVALFVLTAVFGQLISNVATALVVIPIAVAAAEQLGVSARPVLMSVCVAAAAAFLTPVATPANMMVMGPGGYRFGDYWRLGVPLLLVFFAVAVGLVPVIWPF